MSVTVGISGGRAARRRVEVVLKFGGGVVALPRVLSQAAAQNSRDRLAKACHRRFLFHHRAENGGKRIALERQGPGEHFIKHHGQRPQIGFYARGFAEGLLGRHVSGRSQRGAGDSQIGRALHFGQTEIDNAGRSLVAEQNIGRLDIAVNDSARVRRAQPGGNFHRDPERFRDRHRPAGHSVAQRSAGMPRHNDKGLAPILLDAEYGADIGMVQRRRSHCLPQETFAVDGTQRSIADKLQRHGAAQDLIRRGENDTHTAGSQWPRNPVFADNRPGSGRCPGKFPGGKPRLDGNSQFTVVAARFGEKPLPLVLSAGAGSLAQPVHHSLSLRAHGDSFRTILSLRGKRLQASNK